METVLLIAHGTRETRGNDEAAAVARALEPVVGLPVRLCFLEHAVPGIPAAIADLHAEGVRALTALPLILTAAGHVKNDIPAAMAMAQERFPDLRIRIAPHLGAHAHLLSVLAHRHDAANTSPVAADRTGLVVVGRGAVDPDANAEIYKVARLLWESRPAAHLAVGFMGVTRPTVGQALSETVRALAGRETTGGDAKRSRILVVPYFLFRGLLLDRLERECAELSMQDASLEIRVTAAIGADPLLVATLAFRLEELRAGTGHLNCGTCLYRVPTAGLEEAVGGEGAWQKSLGKAHLGGHP